MTPALQLLTRRRLLQIAGTSCGLSLGGLLRAHAASPPIASPLQPLRSCILIFYYGGPSHLETFDLKPDAPTDTRSQFQPISTSVPGLQISEHLPKLSKWMHKAALIRSMSHQARLHDSASIHMLTGRPLDGPDRELFAPQPQFYPSHGGGVAYMQRHEQHVLPFAALPLRLSQRRADAIARRRISRCGLRPAADRGRYRRRLRTGPIRSSRWRD